MLREISMTMDGVYSSVILDKGVVLPGWTMEPAQCVFKGHFANAPLPFVDNENAIK